LGGVLSWRGKYAIGGVLFSRKLHHEKETREQICSQSPPYFFLTGILE